ncbi:MAG: hypothetical protein BKP49_00510 [Treponema sp. CETP13]|nr:MAG: hypothetical protein BKP49_00510 [Treponema sp. CETP13]
MYTVRNKVIIGTRERVEQLITDNLTNANVYFVFPTDIAATVWTERVLELEEGGAVALERFNAWDKFKSESIKSQQQNKTAIPATLRKLFATNILETNKIDCKKGTPLFTSLVVPSYADSSLSFKDWIASLLPQLSSWYEKAQVAHKIEDLFEVSSLDAEDRDLFTLYNAYKDFLDANNLFDPAWEKPPFYDDGKIWYIIYPQILTDFEEYRVLLESANNVCLVDVPDSEVSSQKEEKLIKPTVFTYDNTRAELHALALYLRKIADCSNSENRQRIAWQDIALSVPNIETIEPYLTRELKLYNIPYQLRAGKKLSQYPAGRLFSLIQECVSSNFSFDSIRELVLDKTFPWGDEQAINQLIEFGVKHNCLCSYKDDGKQVDVWQQAFSKASGEERARVFLFGGKLGDEDSKVGLKKALEDICNASTFSEISKYYFVFRNEFFNADDFSTEGDLILSRCVTELQVLMQLQKEFGEAAKCKSPYSFFCSVLDQKDYLAQSEERGVNIFPYRLAASAPYKQQIVIGASQKELSITNQPLHFLSDEKRKKLGITDSVLSKNFITLYAQLSEQTAYFSCSKKNFGGIYSLPHDALASTESTVEEYTEKEGGTVIDAWENEKNYFLHDNSDITTPFVHDMQKIGFLNWVKQTLPNSKESEEAISHYLQNFMLSELQNKEHNGKIRVSATHLKDFAECPLKWLYTRILKVQEASLEATLMDSVWVGDIYHAIIKCVLDDIKNTNQPLHLENDNLPQLYIESISTNCTKVIDGFPKSCGRDKAVSPLTLQMLKMQEDIYRDTLTYFFTSFCSWFAGSKITSTEQEVNYEPEGKNWYYTGRLDCCLLHPGNESMDGGKFIVDFKLGTPPKMADSLQSKTSDMTDFQLSLYVKLYESVFANGKPAVMGASFFSISNSSPTVILGRLNQVIDGKKDKYSPNGKAFVPRVGQSEHGIDFSDSLQKLEEVTQKFVDCISDKDLTTFLHPDFSKIPYETCAGCKFKGLCRTTYSIFTKGAN